MAVRESSSQWISIIVMRGRGSVVLLRGRHARWFVIN